MASEQKPSLRPRPKVAAGGIAAVVAALVIGLATQLGVDLDPALATAIGGLAAFVAAYFRAEAA